jgi:hypothetical protein
LTLRGKPIVIVAFVAIVGLAAAGCGSQCSGSGDSASVEDLTAFGADAGADASVVPPCSTCKGDVVASNFCEGSCFEGPRPSTVTRCMVDACIRTVRDPTSSCEAVCSALLLAGNLTGCSFDATRTKVTCNAHSGGSCRCTAIDC